MARRKLVFLKKPIPRLLCIHMSGKMSLFKWKQVASPLSGVLLFSLDYCKSCFACVLYFEVQVIMCSNIEIHIFKVFGGKICFGLLPPVGNFGWQKILEEVAPTLRRGEHTSQQ